MKVEERNTDLSGAKARAPVALRIQICLIIVAFYLPPLFLRVGELPADVGSLAGPVYGWEIFLLGLGFLCWFTLPSDVALWVGVVQLLFGSVARARTSATIALCLNLINTWLSVWLLSPIGFVALLLRLSSFVCLWVATTWWLKRSGTSG
jgi:hypothetical protein